jgi:hypothetical protein
MPVQFREVLDNTEEEIITQKFNLTLFKSETVFVDEKGQITAKEPVRAFYFEENRPSLKMLYIPSGEFWMGTEAEEIARLVEKFGWDGFKREEPPHLSNRFLFLHGALSDHPSSVASYRRNRLK